MVDLREGSPPGKPAVHWRLLTTKPVTNLIEAMAVADLYRRWWALEQVFRTLETQGFDVENIDIDDAPRSCLIVAALAAAVSVRQLVHARDASHGPLRPMTDAFEPEDLALLRARCRRLEGKTERQKNPHPEESLAPKKASPMPLGSAPGSAAGQATFSTSNTENQARSSW